MSFSLALDLSLPLEYASWMSRYVHCRLASTLAAFAREGGGGGGGTTATTGQSFDRLFLAV